MCCLFYQEIPLEDEEGGEQEDELEDGGMGLGPRMKGKSTVAVPEETTIRRVKGNEADAFNVTQLVIASKSYHSQGQIKADTDSSVNLRLTTPYMSKYERARILGSRALQLRYYSFCSKPEESANS